MKLKNVFFFTTLLAIPLAFPGIRNGLAYIFTSNNLFVKGLIKPFKNCYEVLMGVKYGSDDAINMLSTPYTLGSIISNVSILTLFIAISLSVFHLYKWINKK